MFFQQLSKQQRVAQTTSQNAVQQNSVANVDSGLGPVNPPYSSMDVDSQTESNHDTALTLACAGGHAELVSLLLTKNADIEHRDKKGRFMLGSFPLDQAECGILE